VRSTVPTAYLRAAVVIGSGSASFEMLRVEEAEDGRFLRLRAEMRLPGLAWLELEVGSAAGETTTFRQRALFHPRGFLGHAYWWAVWPFHGLIFGSMQRNVAQAAESLAASGTMEA